MGLLPLSALSTFPPLPQVTATLLALKNPSLEHRACLHPIWTSRRKVNGRSGSIICTKAASRRGRQQHQQSLDGYHPWWRPHACAQAGGNGRWSVRAMTVQPSLQRVAPQHHSVKPCLGRGKTLAASQQGASRQAATLQRPPRSAAHRALLDRALAALFPRVPVALKAPFGAWEAQKGACSRRGGVGRAHQATVTLS